MRLILLALFVLAIVGCESDPPQPPIVVYAPGASESELQILFAEFFSETNIPVSPIWGDSTTNTNRLISNANDPADIVCGVIISFRRREMRYMVWTRKSNDTTLLALGRAIKKNLRHCPRMTYRKHADRRRTGAALYC